MMRVRQNNPAYNTAADIVRIRKSTKSHVSTSLKVLEDSGFIERRVDKDNKKHVTIHLLQLANEVIEDGIWAQKEFAQDMFEGLSEEEIKVFMNVFQKVYDLMSNKNVTQRAELIAGQGPNPSTYGFAELEYMFVNGHGLFYNTTVSSISILKNSSAERNFEFGVLPIPKYDEAQDEYYCAVNRYQSSVLGIPTTNTDNLEATTFLMNALGYYNTHMPSGKTVMDAYYETTLKLQATDTDEDARMLDIIFDSAFYDLGSIFTWGTLSGLYGSVISNDADNTLVSSWQQIESAVTAAMEETVRQYRESIT